MIFPAINLHLVRGFSMAMFNNQRVKDIKPHSTTIFLWSSYGFLMALTLWTLQRLTKGHVTEEQRWPVAGWSRSSPPRWTPRGYLESHLGIAALFMEVL